MSFARQRFLYLLITIMFQGKLDESFNMFKLPTWGGRYNPFINTFKARGILNSNRNIKAHGNLMKRCVKKCSDHFDRRKTIRELEEKSIRAFQHSANQ